MEGTTVAGSSHGSEGCNISCEHEAEQYVEADGERMYLSDGDDCIIAPPPASTHNSASTHDSASTHQSAVEVETTNWLEPTVISENEQSVLYDPDNPRIELNALFPDVYAFRNGLRHFAITTEFEYTIVKSDQRRFVANCAYPGCSWRIRACRLRDNNKTFKITVLPNIHTCPSVGRDKGTMVSKSWVAERAADFLRTNPSAGAKAVQETLVREFHVTLNYSKAWAGRAAALEGLQGSWENSFKLVYDFKAEVESKCPGSIVEIECEKDGKKMRFSKMFVALKPCINGFLHGCRPYLALDSTHLTGRYRGQLATACGVDGFNWLYPVAYGVFDSETTETWTWFMTQLKKAIGDVPRLVISSDGCKGLDNGAANIFPEAERRVCYNHLKTNFKKKFHGKTFDDNFEPAAYASTTAQCEKHLSEIKKASVKAFNYLEKQGLWCRSKFSEASKVDYVTNNISESFNKWIKDLKDLHVIEMLNQIRQKLMVTFDRRRKVLRKLNGKIVPSVMKELSDKSRSSEVKRMTVRPASAICAEVSGTTSKGTSWTHTVHIDKQQCSCKSWQISGKPYSHAIAFISTRRLTLLEDYVHEYYSIERFRLAYEGVINPIVDASMWVKSDIGFTVWPPIMDKRPTGRPRKERIPSCLELGTRKQQCKRCRGFGHQARTCREAVEEGQRTRKRKRKAVKKVVRGPSERQG